MTFQDLFIKKSNNVRVQFVRYCLALIIPIIIMLGFYVVVNFLTQLNIPSPLIIIGMIVWVFLGFLIPSFLLCRYWIFEKSFSVVIEFFQYMITWMVIAILSSRLLDAIRTILFNKNELSDQEGIFFAFLSLFVLLATYIVSFFVIKRFVYTKKSNNLSQDGSINQQIDQSQDQTQKPQNGNDV